MMFVLEPHKKEEAIKLIEESSDDLNSPYATINFHKYDRFFLALNRIHVPFRNGALGPVRNWSLKDCIAVHKLLWTILVDHDAASSESFIIMLCVRYFFKKKDYTLI